MPSTTPSRQMPLIVGIFATILLLSCVRSASAQTAAVAASESKRSATTEPVSSKPLKGMLVTGGCCHDYEAQKFIVTEGISQRVAPVEWTIHHYGEAKDTRATVYDNADWAEGYDLIVHNECFGAMEDAALVERIIDGHRKSKVPAIFIHCSMHSYRTSASAESWREFVGVTSTFHEKEKRSLSPLPTSEGKAAGIAGPLVDAWQTPEDELYIITKVWPGTEVLATAFSVEKQADQALVWRREEPGVRVFGTTLGHSNETMKSPQWQEVLALGVKWALGTKSPEHE